MCPSTAVCAPSRRLSAMYEDIEIEDGPANKFQAAFGASARSKRGRARAGRICFLPVSHAPPAFRRSAARKWQHWLDLSAPHVGPRWALSAGVMFIYCLRVYLINGWYIITYGLGIYVLNLLIGFLSPQSDPETEGPVRLSARPQACSGQQRPTAAGWRCTSAGGLARDARAAPSPLP